MTRRPSEDELAYWRSSGLEAILDELRAEPERPIPPDIPDLVRLHRLIRERPCVTVLEFGVGFSTLVMAHALAANESLFGAEMRKSATRNSHLFQLFSVDANPAWIERTQRRLLPSLNNRVYVAHSAVSATTFGGRLCHLYDVIPDVIPDLIYVDGPDPHDVGGAIHGLTFQTMERTVMAADLLLMEPTLLPGTIVVIDGRENNARFLVRNLQRPVEVSHQDDVTIIEFVEARLGRINVIGVDVFGREGSIGSSRHELRSAVSRG